MTCLVFTVKADADAVSAAVDARLGYPKPGTDVGDGTHVPPAQSVTLRHGDVVKHPILPQWRYPDDAPVESELSKALAIPVSGSKQVIDEVGWGLKV